MATQGRRWGWHRLAPDWADRLVDESGVQAGETVLDIGAGGGAIAASLVDAGARVIAVEAHPGRARWLRERFGDSIVVVQADAGDLRLPRHPFRVVSNPPFAVTTALMRRLLQRGSRMYAADLILQRQAAQRWASSTAPGAGRWARHFDVALGRRVPRAAMSPPPRVDMRLLVVRRRGG